MRIALATFNEGKFEEVRRILADAPIELVPAWELGLERLPEEDGETFLENALTKAVHVFRFLGMPALADDSGLEVPALGGEPGVQSARYSGREHDDCANISALLAKMRGISNRKARFVCAAVLVASPDHPALAVAQQCQCQEVSFLPAHRRLGKGEAAAVAVGEVWGRIIETPRGRGGFGFDPVFFRDDLGKTFAELSAEEKNALSHRGKAFRAIGRLLSLT